MKNRKRTRAITGQSIEDQLIDDYGPVLDSIVECLPGLAKSVQSDELAGLCERISHVYVCCTHHDHESSLQAILARFAYAIECIEGGQEVLDKLGVLERRINRLTEMVGYRRS